MTDAPPPISCLWIAGRLSFLELLCLTSMHEAGHRVTLWSYEDIPNRPDFAAPADARAILPDDRILTHRRTGSPAPHSDRFRFRLLAARPGTVWADTDAYVVRALSPEGGRLYGWESPHRVNSGVIALPQGSPALAAIAAFTEDAHPIPPWFDAAERAALTAARDAGAPVHAADLSWGLWGPQATTYFLAQSGEIAQALPAEALYPIAFRDRRALLKPGDAVDRAISGATQSVHLYGRRIRKRLIEREGGAPKPDSWMGRMLCRHGIDPRAAPIGAMAEAAD